MSRRPETWAELWDDMCHDWQMMARAVFLVAWLALCVLFVIW